MKQENIGIEESVSVLNSLLDNPEEIASSENESNYSFSADNDEGGDEQDGEEMEEQDGLELAQSIDAIMRELASASAEIDNESEDAEFDSYDEDDAYPEVKSTKEPTKNKMKTKKKITVPAADDTGTKKTRGRPKGIKNGEGKTSHLSTALRRRQLLAKNGIAKGSTDPSDSVETHALSLSYKAVFPANTGDMYDEDEDAYVGQVQDDEYDVVDVDEIRDRCQQAYGEEGIEDEKYLTHSAIPKQLLQSQSNSQALLVPLPPDPDVHVPLTKEAKRAAAEKASRSLRTVNTVANRVATAAAAANKRAANIRDVDDGPRSNNGGVYRSTVVGLALLAALKEMTQMGSLGTDRKSQSMARQAILALFDRSMEDQIATVTQQSSATGNATDHGLAALLHNAGATNTRKIKNDALQSAKASGSGNFKNEPAISQDDTTSSGVSKRRDVMNIQSPTLRGTIDSFQSMNGVWKISCTDAVLATGGVGAGRILNLPRIDLMFKARDERVVGESGSQRGNKRKSTNVIGASSSGTFIVKREKTERE